jgi:hypothetical protein
MMMTEFDITFLFRQQTKERAGCLPQVSGRRWKSTSGKRGRLVAKGRFMR